MDHWPPKYSCIIDNIAKIQKSLPKLPSFHPLEWEKMGYIYKSLGENPNEEVKPVARMKEIPKTRQITSVEEIVVWLPNCANELLC